MKTLCKKTETRGTKPTAQTVNLQQHLRNFLFDHYPPRLQTLNYSQIGNILKYMAKDVVTMYENNIKQNYLDYIETYVNVCLQKKQHIECINTSDDTATETNSRETELCNDLKKSHI